jgi:3-hydroxyacyl-CoA dehydrogenase
LDIRKVVVVGSGILGQQVAFQCAFHGFETVVFNPRLSSLDTCRVSLRRYAEFLTLERGVRPVDVDAAFARLTYTHDLAEACREADLVSESVPEDPDVKRRTFAALNQFCPAKTIFATNSSTLLPSQLADATGRPDRFVALHFANEIWDRNVGEVMGHVETDPATIETVVEFAKAIGMVPIRVCKEQSGYVLNSMSVPWLMAAQALVTNGVARPEDVDRTWMIATKMALGPFGFVDMIGVETVYNVASYWGNVNGDEQLIRNAAYLKTHFIDQGRLGTKTGRGYYTHPNPAYRRPDFLS